jgi:hypothetical protein
MNEHWVKNIRGHYDTVKAVLAELEGKYNLLENETEIYNEEMQGAVDALSEAVVALDEALRAVKHDSEPDSSSR